MFSRFFLVFYNSSKIKVFYSIIVFRQRVMIEMSRYFMGILWGVVFMENLLVRDIIFKKGLILTLSPDLMRPRG